MEGRLSCNAFFKCGGTKYPIHIDRRGKWWALDGGPIMAQHTLTLSSSVAEVDDRPAWALHNLNMAFIQREAELGELEPAVLWGRGAEVIFNDL